MQHKILALVSLLVLTACKSNPNKAQKLETELAQSQAVSGSQQVGIKNGEMVVMSKEQMSERLRDLQNGVYAMEDKVYGTRKLGSQGMYGELKACRRKLSSPQFGGTGNMMWSEPLDRVTDKEEEFKTGLDEKKELVAVNEEYLRDRLQRFQTYRHILQKRSDEFSERIEACKAEAATKEMDTNQPNRIMVSEVPKSVSARAEINQYICSYVRPGASLQSFLLNAFAKGWLSLNDYRMGQNLLAASLKDAKGAVKENALLFNGWRLAFDQSQVTVGELLNDGKDAGLLAWAFERKADLPNGCLAKPDGEWNP